MSITGSLKRCLYRRLSLENYLRVLSAGFFAGLRSGLGRRSGVYEYPRFLKRLVRRGDTVIDIGANLGYYSRILSDLAGPRGKVYAVEPVRPILGVLKRNLHDRTNVEIIPYALGQENKKIEMVNDSTKHTGYMGTGRNYIPRSDADSGSGCESPKSRNAGVVRGDSTSGETGVASQITFAAEMRLGSQLFQDLKTLDFIKCDIEGYETVVIPEMAPLIKKHLPIVLLETGGANRRGMIELFREWGYAGYVLQKGRLISVMRAPEKDIVFIPGHRHADLEKLTVK